MKEREALAHRVLDVYCIVIRTVETTVSECKERRKDCASNHLNSTIQTLSRGSSKSTCIHYRWLSFMSAVQGRGQNVTVYKRHRYDE